MKLVEWEQASCSWSNYRLILYLGIHHRELKNPVIEFVWGKKKKTPKTYDQHREDFIKRGVIHVDIKGLKQISKYTGFISHGKLSGKVKFNILKRSKVSGPKPPHKHNQDKQLSRRRLQATESTRRNLLKAKLVKFQQDTTGTLHTEWAEFWQRDRGNKEEWCLTLNYTETLQP